MMLALNVSANLENSAMVMRLENVSFHSSSKEGQCQKKNAQTTRQLHSFHMLAKLCSKFFKLGFNSIWTKNFQMYKLDLNRQRNQRSNCQQPLDHRRSKGILEKHLVLLSLSTLKPLTVSVATNCGFFTTVPPCLE